MSAKHDYQPLFKNTDLFEQMLSNSSALITIKDIQGRYLRVNPQFERLFDLKQSEVVGKTAYELFPKDFAEQIHQHDQMVLEAQSFKEFEEKIVFGDEARIVLASKYPLLDEHGRVQAICTISLDVTERKRDETALRNAALAVSSARGQDIFQQLVRYLAATLNVDYTFIGVLDDDPRLVNTLAVYYLGEFKENVQYDVTTTPCRDVIGKQSVYLPEGIQELYPDDIILQKLDFHSYAAYPLFDSAGRALGLIAITHSKPLKDRNLVEAMLKIFSVRAAAEIERMQVERERQISESSYREIFDASEDAIFVHDIDTGAILDVNPKVCSAYGYTREEMQRIDVETISSGEHPYTREQALKYIDRARAGEIVRFEWHSRNKDGSLHWDEVVLKRAKLAGADRVVAFTREISERKAAEQALRNSEEQYRTIFNASVDGLLLWTLDGRIVDANPAFYRMHGYQCGELLEGDPRSCVSPDSYPQYQQFTRTIATGESCRVEGQGIRRDGSVFDVEMHGTLVHYRGKPHLLAILRDVTERKERESALRKSEDRLRATVEAAFDCIISTDARGRIIEFNPAAEICFGYKRDDIIGAPLDRLVMPGHDRKLFCAGSVFGLGTAASIGQRLQIDARRADGSVFQAELAISAARGSEGDIFVACLRDLTEQKRAEEQRSQLETQLRQAQKMEAIGHLTGGIAHDFNNMLTAITGYAEMALEHPVMETDRELKRYLEQIRRAGEKASVLVKQMLTFSRGQRGKAKALSLSPLIKESVKLFQSTFPSTVEFQTTIDAQIPAVIFDVIQAEQVLMNLCINARDAMDAQGVITLGLSHRGHCQAVCSSCRKTVTGDFVQLSVSDNGKGAAQEVVDRMFEPFYTTKDVGKGSGMGLAMVHGIIHEYAGHIEVETAPGAGATFRVLFPVADRALDPNSERIGGRGRETEYFRGRVLLVDDESSVMEFMRDLLVSRGFEVVTAGNGEEAIVRFIEYKNKLNLVITDQTMPKVTGIELAAVLMKIDPQLPVILYTGYSENLRDETVQRVGVKAYLRKPVDVRELFNTIRRILPADGGGEPVVAP